MSSYTCDNPQPSTPHNNYFRRHNDIIRLYIYILSFPLHIQEFFRFAKTAFDTFNFVLSPSSNPVAPAPFSIAQLYRCHRLPLLLKHELLGKLNSSGSWREKVCGRHVVVVMGAWGVERWRGGDRKELDREKVKLQGSPKHMCQSLATTDNSRGQDRSRGLTVWEANIKVSWRNRTWGCGRDSAGSGLGLTEGQNVLVPWKWKIYCCTEWLCSSQEHFTTGFVTETGGEWWRWLSQKGEWLQARQSGYNLVKGVEIAVLATMLKGFWVHRCLLRETHNRLFQSAEFLNITAGSTYLTNKITAKHNYI